MGIFDLWKKMPSAKSGETRKQETHVKLQAMGISINPHLPLLETAQEVQIKGKDAICKRAVAALLAIQVACDRSEGQYDGDSKAFFTDLLHRFNVIGHLNDTERRVVFEDSVAEQDIVAVMWTYEAYWSLAWALGLVSDITDASDCCDGEAAVHFVSDCESYDEFYKTCQVRAVDDILDMLDLYYRYHWACVNKRYDPNTNIGHLNTEVVWERRRGLEWLIAHEEDWFSISLDT